MTKKAKNFINLFGAIFFSALLLTATIAIVRKNINLDLSKASKITGRVISSGIIMHKHRGGKIRLPAKVLFINLDNSTTTFATYRPKQDYSKLAGKS